MMKRLICRIASGWSRCVRMQVFSHRWSQTRPRIDGSGLSSRVMRTASARSPDAHRGHVAGHLLVHRALVQAGRRDAVEGAERAGVFDRSVRNDGFSYRQSCADPVGVGAEVDGRSGATSAGGCRAGPPPAASPSNPPASAVRRMKSSMSAAPTASNAASSRSAYWSSRR